MTRRSVGCKRFGSIPPDIELIPPYLSFSRLLTERTNSRCFDVCRPMAQLFRSSSNVLARVSIYGFLALAAFAVLIAVLIYDSDYVTGVRIFAEQPIPFSHKHHVSDDGIDCRYCHTTVEYSSFAGIPSTETCMSCHSEIWKTSPMLEPVRSSYLTDRSIQWQRVHLLPDYVYFNHGIHVSKGIGCSTCHGRVQDMPLTWRAKSLRMSWCLDCHRAPQNYVRPHDQVFNMEWEPPKDQSEQGARLVREYKIPTTRMTDCYTCHR